MLNSMNFTNKTVLITGGSRGIGLACAQAFASRGARVAIAYKHNHDAATKALESLAGEGHMRIAGDLAEPAFSREVIAEVVAAFGGLDVVVNNAGIFKRHAVNEVGFEVWQNAWHETLAVNLLAPANIMYHAAQYMMARDDGRVGGRIVNVSSRGAFRGEPDSPAYGASKAGLNALSQSLAYKLAPERIFVGVVAPGFVETDMAAAVLAGDRGDELRHQSPLKRVAKPEEVAHAVLFLASEGAEFSTGTIIDVNGASYLRS